VQTKIFLRALTLVLASVSAISSLQGYILITDDSGIYVVKWQTSPVNMQNKLPASPILSDGNTLSSSVAAAMPIWNAQLGTVQLASTVQSSTTYATGNKVNEIVKDSTADGEAFAAGTLAVTLSYRSGNERVESDIVFNSAYNWDSYRGALHSGVQDIQRVAIHELGHVLGLDHPDEHGQGVLAIMNSHISSIDTLQSDDIAGGQKLYGPPGFKPANDNFANAIPISLESGTVQVTGSNIAATRETGEPNHVNVAEGHSVWWKWTPLTNGSATVDTLGSDFDTVLAVYTGTSVSALTLVASNDDAESPTDNPTSSRKRTSIVTFTVTGGTTYWLAVDGWGDIAHGDIPYTGSVTLNVGIVPITSPPVIISATTASVDGGKPFTYTITAANSPTSFSATGLPAGLSVDSVTGKISGSPTVTGVFSVQLGATNLLGTGNATLTLTVKAMPALTWAAPAAITYGTALSSVQLGASASVPGTFAYAPAAGAVLSAGSQTLGVTFTPTDTASYATATATQTLTVNKATLTATADNQSRVYGTANPALTVSYAGFVNNDTAAAITAPIADTAASTASAVGTYPITLTGGAAANYTLTPVNGTLTVTKAALAAIADDKSKLQGTANPALTISYAGFVNADTKAAITEPTISTLATVASSVGTYPITLTGGSAANYTLTLTNGMLTVALGSHLVNLSTRAPVGTGDNVLIVGFVLTGSAPKPVIIRGVGPALAAAPFNMAGTLPDPVFDLYRSGTVIASNDNWATAGNQSALTADMARVGAFSLNATSLDSVISTTLNPGVYSAILRGNGTANTGVGVVEIYDATAALDPTAPRMVNISSRGFVGTGNDVLIGGFVVTGDQPRQVLIRGVGPTLATLGVTAPVLADPLLSLYRNGTAINQNDNWGSAGDGAALSAAATAVGAFALPGGSKDAALLTALQPGVYSVIVSGVGNTTGIALVEIYEVGN
jgi:hypothetical protein